ncbi:hypothetical protein ACXR6G_01470 [Ancylomarina sp. YFZ004]
MKKIILSLILICLFAFNSICQSYNYKNSINTISSYINLSESITKNAYNSNDFRRICSNSHQNLVNTIGIEISATLSEIYASNCDCSDGVDYSQRIQTLARAATYSFINSNASNSFDETYEYSEEAMGKLDDIKYFLNSAEYICDKAISNEINPTIESMNYKQVISTVSSYISLAKSITYRACESNDLQRLYTNASQNMENTIGIEICATLSEFHASNCNCSDGEDYSQRIQTLAREATYLFVNVNTSDSLEEAYDYTKKALSKLDDIKYVLSSATGICD